MGNSESLNCAVFSKEQYIAVDRNRETRSIHARSLSKYFWRKFHVGHLLLTSEDVRNVQRQKHCNRNIKEEAIMSKIHKEFIRLLLNFPLI